MHFRRPILCPRCGHQVPRLTGRVVERAFYAQAGCHADVLDPWDSGAECGCRAPAHRRGLVQRGHAA